MCVWIYAQERKIKSLFSLLIFFNQAEIQAEWDFISKSCPSFVVPQRVDDQDFTTD